MIYPTPPLVVRLLPNVGKAQVLLDLPDIAKLLPGILSADAGWHDDVLALLPVNGCSDALLVSCLQAVDDSQYLGGVPAGARGV